MSDKSSRPNKYFDIYAPVFYPSALLILLFIGLTLGIGKPMEEVFQHLSASMTTHFGWLLVLAVNAFLIFCIYLAASKFGGIRLGGKDARPEFSLFAWFAMLFSAGMGIGLLFFSVAEPVIHFSNPPTGAGGTIEAARNAMKLTFLHYGFHAWAIYALVGLALAFFAYNRGLPLSIRSTFFPLLGKRIHGPAGHVIDVVSVVATLFGLATSLGLGVQQIASGLHHLFGLPNETWMQVLLIVLITLIATGSVVSGLDKGIRVLSEMNMRLGIVFLALMLLLGPTVYLLDGFIQNTGAYLQGLVAAGTWTETYAGTNWQNTWTVFYWAWWISWSPFVGIFIAAVSKGRTIRQFVLGVLLVPAMLTFLWLSVFGGSALYLGINEIADIASAVNEDISTALFVMLESYPLGFLTSMLGIVLVTSFFVTSSDSGSLVIDSITSGGKLNTPVGQRIFWAFSEGAVAIALLIGGGLIALQAAVVSTGLPFALLLIVMCFSLHKGLSDSVESPRSNVPGSPRRSSAEAR